MHIPDGYLSPATCASLYAASLPFWSSALRRLERVLRTRAVPLVSLFAAYSFVIMMFNIPLPGGTTGHAMGAAIAAVVVGPWAALIAVSVALALQAFLFGDGGITALGANCFNIAIAGSFVAWWVNRLVAAGSPTTARRRVVAAAIAGYAAANASALLTAVQLGIQPMLYLDAGGAPLYAPYRLEIAVPAMMLGHLTFAGLAEAVLTAGIVAWLQNNEPAMLEMEVAQPRAMNLRPLWAGLSVLMLATPLGLLAAGTAWGEWSAGDLADGSMRPAITSAALGAEPPAAVPAGLARLSALWTAPISDYAPSFMRHEGFGYLLSAVFGVGLILAAAFVIRALTERRARAAG